MDTMHTPARLAHLVPALRTHWAMARRTLNQFLASADAAIHWTDHDPFADVDDEPRRLTAQRSLVVHNGSRG